LSAVSSKTIGSAFCWENAGHPVRMLFLGLGLVWTAHCAMAADDSAAPEPRHGQAQRENLITFDLPAQPLVSALEAYGAASGSQVVYEGALATGRRSSAVKGAFTPAAALRNLLIGTGLAPRYMAADGFVLIPEPAPAAHRNFPLNMAPLPVVTRYYGRIQAALRQSVCADERARSGGYRVAVGLWVGGAGAVGRSALLDTTGDPDLDATLEQDLRNVSVGEAPPAGFAQPVVMVITPDVIRECRADRDGAPQIKAGP